MKQCVIGLDIGTTCTKALVAAADGTVLSQGAAPYDLLSDGAKIEQRAEDWIAAAVAAIRQACESLDGYEVAAISLSTQAASTAAVDENGSFIANAWTWMDSRSTAQAGALEAQLGGDYIYKTTGWRVNPALDAAKILNMKSLPAFRGAKKYLTTLEILNRFLTDNDAIDPTNAAMRQLFSVERGDWDDRILHAVGLTRSELPKILPTGAYLGGLTDSAAAATGLTAGIPVYNGAHDQYCASLGAGAVHAGDMLLSAGTTWVVMGIGNAPMFTKSYIASGQHPVHGLYGAIASLVCSGASLEWFKKNFLTEDFREIDREASLRRDKVKELFFFPYMAGANYPVWNLDAKGAFTGVGLEHDRFDFTRAIMEGVAFGVRRAVDDFAANGVDVQSIVMMGGAARSEVWIRMISDITGVPIRRLSQSDVCALGAASIAATGAGLFPSYEKAAAAMVHPEKTFTPDPENYAWYREKFAAYDRMWQSLSAYYGK